MDNCDVDPLRESVLNVCEWEPSSMTSAALGWLNKALKDLRLVGATAEDVYTRANRYQAKWPDALTPSALAKHWASLAADSTNGNSSNSNAIVVDDTISRMASARDYGKDRSHWDEDKLRDQATFQSLPPDEQDEALAGWRDAQPEPALVAL